MNSSEAFCLTNWGISLYTSFVRRKSQGFSFVFPWYTRNLLIERQVYLHYENNVVTILRKGDMKKLVNGLKINFVMDYRQWWGLLVELNKEKTDWENYSMFQKWCLRRTIWTFCHNLIPTCYAHKKKSNEKEQVVNCWRFQVYPIVATKEVISNCELFRSLERASWKNVTLPPVEDVPPRLHL